MTDERGVENHEALILQVKSLKWKSRIDWQEGLKNITQVFAVVGLISYGVLALSYDQFYGRLGVNPSDVGLTYANILAGAVGMAITTIASIVVVLAVVLYMIVSAVAVAASRQRRRRRSSAGFERTTQRVDVRFLIRAIFIPGVLFSVGLEAYGLIQAGSGAAAAVKDGRPVLPLQRRVTPNLTSVTLLAIRADPVTVEAAGLQDQAKGMTEQANVGRVENERTTNPLGATSLKGRSLLYLGQSGGIAVLYDHNSEEVVYTTISSNTLSITNCRTVRAPETKCRNYYRP